MVKIHVSGNNRTRVIRIHTLSLARLWDFAANKNTGLVKQTLVAWNSTHTFHNFPHHLFWFSTTVLHTIFMWIFLRCSFAALFYSLSNACVQKLYVVQICPRVPSIRECRVLGALCGGTPISITYSVAVALHHQTPAFRLLREFSTKLSRLCTCDRKRAKGSSLCFI